MYLYIRLKIYRTLTRHFERIIMNIIDQTLKDIRYTDTRLGSLSSREFSNGNTLPLSGVPHGNNYMCLMTRNDPSFFFNPTDDKLMAFRISHQPSPWMGDFSFINILPFDKDESISYDRNKSIFRPNFMKIYYKDNKVSYSSMLDLSGIIETKGLSNFKIFAKGLKLNKSGDFIEGFVNNYSGCEDKDLKMYIKIGLSASYEFSSEGACYYIRTDEKNVSLKFATSFLSIGQARLNFKKSPNKLNDFIEESKRLWDGYFDIFDLEERPYEDNFSKFTPYKKIDKLRFFYHCVYRSFLFPMKFYEKDKDGNDFYYDTLSKDIKSGKFYTNIGFWDGQKTLFPLLSLVAADDLEDMLEGILNFYRDTGFLPKWLSPDERGIMPGTLVDNVIADAISKGIGTNMKEDFLKAMVDVAEKESKDHKYGRFKAKIYRKLGYVPAEYEESVNQSLDNSLADYSIGRLAEICGKKDLADRYYSYSRNWENLFDRESKLMRDKDKEGNFCKNFDPLAWGSPYTEGSAYQNSYNAYHDFSRLIELFGSKEDFEKRLDYLSNAKSSFNFGAYGMEIHEMTEMHDAHLGQIAISNQPSFHLPYLYNLVGKAWKSELIIKTIMKNYFSYSFRAYPGDEDNGSMSAWFILSAMGIYPLCPGSGSYEMGISFFDKMKVKLSNGNILEIETRENYPHKNFVKAIKVDGKLKKDKKISHEDLIRAKKISFSLGLVPSKDIV